MSILSEQEITQVVRDAANGSAIRRDGLTSYRIARAIEAKVIEKIKAQEPVAWLHSQRTDSDVVTDAVKSVWGKVAVGSLAQYTIPLYKLPEGD